MKRLFHILVFFCFSLTVFAQEETRAIDSLQDVMRYQEGREKVLTMMELSRVFFDFSFDDCIDWSEKAIQLAHETHDVELDGDANFALGIHYGYHSDLDLAQLYLKRSLHHYQQSGNEDKAFESLWNLAYFELLLGNMDTACIAFQEVISLAEQRGDSSAYAIANGNLAYIQYLRNDFVEAMKAYELTRDIFALLNDNFYAVQAELNIAIILGECGKINEARVLFGKVIPQLEALQENEILLTAYKNYGMLFERDLINYDSASYYFEKVLACAESETFSRADRQTMANTKADVLVEMGNVAASLNEITQAVYYYNQAMALAKNNSYHFGQMQAALGLGQLYAKQGRATQSLHYFDIYSEKANRSGITMMEPVIKKSLIMNYARLGRFAEMEKELDDLDEQRSTLARENYDIKEQNRNLSHDAEDLRRQHESQNNVIQTLQTQRNHYRLAFFGLLVIVISMLVFFTAYKIVRKKRTKV